MAPCVGPVAPDGAADVPLCRSLPRPNRVSVRLTMPCRLCGRALRERPRMGPSVRRAAPQAGHSPTRPGGAAERRSSVRLRLHSAGHRRSSGRPAASQPANLDRTESARFRGKPATASGRNYWGACRPIARRPPVLGARIAQNTLVSGGTARAEPRSSGQRTRTMRAAAAAVLLRARRGCSTGVDLTTRPSGCAYAPATEPNTRMKRSGRREESRGAEQERLRKRKGVASAQGEDAHHALTGVTAGP